MMNKPADPNKGSNLSPSAQRVQQALANLGLTLEVMELPASTRTAAQAAEAVGCLVDQIAKSLIFRGQQTGKAILVITSGANRVDEARLSQIAGEPIGKAEAEFVRQQTGFAIGGVPPVGHANMVETYIDEDLLKHEQIWAAAGTPNALFHLTPQELLHASHGRVMRVKE